MLAGPRVDVYVGPRKKHYLLPKLLLCYYSPFFLIFEKCFNGPFKEGQTQKLELPEDRVEFFEIMIEFMLHGKVENVGSIHEFNLNSTATEDKNEFIEFIKYNDKYGLGEISEAAEQEFSELLVDKVDVSDIEVVFGALPAGSPLRTMLVHEIFVSNTFEDTQKFRSQEHSIPGYAAEVLDYLRANFDVTMKRGKSTR